MMFTTFLNEGLIKLPPKVLKDAISFFLEKYLAYLYFNVKDDDDDLDETEKKMVEATLKQLAKKHDISLPDSREIAAAGKVKTSYRKIPVKDIPKAYLKSLIARKPKDSRYPVKELTKNIVLTFTIAFDEHKEVRGELGEKGVYIEDKNEIVISLSGLELRFKDVKDLILSLDVKGITERINAALGTIEHELTHFVQFKILALLDKKQIEGDDNDDATYYSSQVEFDPFIKTSIRKIKTLIGHEKAKTPREVFDIFTWADSEDLKTSKPSSPTLRSAFFKALKKKNMNNWKKAVKLLSQEVLK